MYRVFHLGWLALCLLPCLAIAQQTAAPVHPRLLFGADDVPALRQKITQQPWQAMYEKLVADVDADGWGGRQDLTSLATAACVAERSAFLYVVTGDDAWAKKARAQVERCIADKQGWANPGGKGLGLFWQGSRVALAYDWCYGAPSWDAAFCQTVSTALKKHGDVIHQQGGSGQNRDAASNWQGGRYASGGLCLLATDEVVPQADLDGCFGRVQRYLRENLNDNARSRGWNAEGLGYNYYPMGNFVGPFGIAMARKDPAKDIRKMSCVGWTYWTTYATHIKALGTVIRPDFGDDNAGTAGEGTYGQAFYYCPEALKPGLVYVYDRLWGDKGDQSYDPARCGTIYSILYHPGRAVAEQDPMSLPAWRAGFVDLGGNGYFTYRNGYKLDTSDVVGQLYVKLRGDRGHAGPDALSFRIQGLDTAWAVGGGRYGPKTNGQDVYWRSQDTVYPVDPDATLATNGNSGKVVGTPVSNADGSGAVVASITQNNVGAKNHKRWFISDFGKASGAAATFVVGDTSDDGKFWQFCTLEQNTITTAGNTFTVTAKNGATLQGTVLYPTGDLQWKTGTRPRGTGFVTDNNNFIHFQSADGKFLVVLTLAQQGQAQPKVSCDGDWAAAQQATVTVGNLKVRIDGDVVVTQ